MVTSHKIAPNGARSMRHAYYNAIRTWSAVCSTTPLSQFDEGARLHLYMDEWYRSTPVHKRLKLTQAIYGKLIPSLAQVLGMKTRSLEVFSEYIAFHLELIRPLRSADAESGKVYK